MVQKIEVKEEIARDIVNDWITNRVQDRYFYMRFYVSIRKFIEFKDIASYVRGPSYIAEVDGYRLFTDSQLKMNIFEKQLKRRKPKR